MKNAFLIAAPHSGAGKTTITLSLLALLMKRGHTVQSYKVGPDYIDPMHHAAVTGRPGANLDSWMLSPETNKAVFARYSNGADTLLVEGVMGLYDGIDGVSRAGSSAEIARSLGLPILLVLDARSMARSVAALAKGFTSYEPDLKFAGILLNRVGSPAHERILREALSDGPPVLGVFGRNTGVSLGERHLGLVTPEDSDLTPDWVDTLARFAADSVDLDRTLSLTRIPDPPPPPAKALAGKKLKLAVARDRAFAFYYNENFSVLETLGAELAFFSPVEGDGLPQGADALYLGGGYPELYAERLSSNEAFMSSVKGLHARGGAIYAECGGFMTLCRSITDKEGKLCPMAGIFPADVRMRTGLSRLGYREVEGATGTNFEGMKARGHEFHYSEIDSMPDDVKRGYLTSNARGEPLLPEGYVAGSALGGYIHLHFASNPSFAGKIFGLA